MKKIKLFEEASNINEVWIVNVVYYDGDVESTRVFSTKEKAVDFYIKEINKEFGVRFEPMVDDSGIRNFHTADENPDFLRAVNYMKDRLRYDFTKRFYIDGYKVE